MLPEFSKVQSALSVQLLDRADPPESLASFVDGPDGWKQVCSIVRCLERETDQIVGKANRAW